MVRELDNHRFHVNNKFQKFYLYKIQYAFVTRFLSEYQTLKHVNSIQAYIAVGVEVNVQKSQHSTIGKDILKIAKQFWYLSGAVKLIIGIA